MRTGAATVLILMLSASGCEKPQNAEEERSSVVMKLPDSLFAVDLSSPDRALQSYWRLRDIEYATTAADTLTPYHAFVNQWAAAREGLLGGSALLVFQEPASPRETFHREIVEVEQESETRAIVLARIRNTTPIPEGAIVSERELEDRTDGETFRYIFEKFSVGWKLTQIQRADFLTGEWEDYHRPGRQQVSTWVYP